MEPNGQDIAQLQAAIREAGVFWEAGITAVSELSREEKLRRLGFVPPPGAPTFEEVARQISARRAAVMAEQTIGAPTSFDLRNVNGANFITSIKDQGNCGSCVAFGAVSVVEGTLRYQRRDPNLQVDLSESHLFYCLARAQGRNCGNGWYPDAALECFKNPGVADNACYPYTAGDQNCTNLCADWQNRVVQITGYHKLNSLLEIKDWISTQGPLTGCFLVYDDFFNYRSGVYRHVSGDLAGGHCVSIIGYDDADGYWICKNSWGTGWGENGFFRIGYGECGIDTTYGPYAVDGIVQSGWLNNRKIVGLWTIDQDRNAWVYLDGNIGWRRLAYDNDNIFFDLLTQTSTAKAANRPVNVRQASGVVVELYVL